MSVWLRCVCLCCICISLSVYRYQSIFQSIWLLVCIYSYLYFCISGLYISKCIIYVYIMHLSIFTFPLSIVFLIDFFCQNRISISDLYTILISNSTISSFWERSGQGNIKNWGDRKACKKKCGEREEEYENEKQKVKWRRKRKRKTKPRRKDNAYQPKREEKKERWEKWKGVIVIIEK